MGQTCGQTFRVLAHVTWGQQEIQSVFNRRKKPNISSFSRLQSSKFLSPCRAHRAAPEGIFVLHQKDRTQKAGFEAFDSATITNTKRAESVHGQLRVADAAPVSHAVGSAYASALLRWRFGGSSV